MKITSLILLLFVSLGYAASAQDAIVTMTMGEYEMVKARIDSLSSVLVSNHTTIDSLNNVLRAQDSVIGRLRGQLKSINDIQQGSDSVIVALKDSLSIQANEIMGLRKEVAALDMVRLRYANGRLQLPFNQEKVNEAIELFNGISDSNLKNECNEVLTWLRQYSFYLRDVQELIWSIQSDNRRENKFKFDEWRTSSLNEINQNSYVRNSQGHQFSIIYLDEIITIAKSRLTKATKPTVDFSDLIERLQL
ncbi:MAG: hypothetical protein HDS23_06400 [Bacteroides sp.]|nr:hypothetical protein [Bacteroides sp.]